MREFEISLHSVKDVQEFVAIATSRPYRVVIRDQRNKISATSFMELFCLDFSRPLRVQADCTEEELEALRRDAQQFLHK